MTNGQQGRAADPGVVIVGASLAGLHAAEALRAEGWGGRITLVDSDSMPWFDRPPMSKGYLAGELAADRLRLRDDDRLSQLDAEWILGEPVTHVDLESRRVLAGGREVDYRELVIATGVTPLVPPALAVPSAHVLRTKSDADRLREQLDGKRSLIVVGGGFVGMEVAATFRGLGARVELVEACQTPLYVQVGPVIGRVLQEIHEHHGVSFHLGRRATGAEELPGGVSVELDDGAVLEAEALLVAIGSVPRTEFLMGHGPALDDGVGADANLQVAPHVHAIGDVVRWPHPLAGRSVRIEHWTTAVEQARYVAKRIAGSTTLGPFEALPYFWSDQYDRRLQVHGFPAPSGDIEVLDGSLEDERFAAVCVTDGRATAAIGINSPKQVLAGRRRVINEMSM